MNPALGDETAVKWVDARRPRHVVVVGGGPAGMETARIARLRGHRVTLLETSDRLGGTMWFSQLTTQANGPLVDWQVHELDRSGVVVELGRPATVASIEVLRPDVVVVATGAHRGLPAVPGATLPHVQTGDGLRALVTGEGTADAPRWLQAMSTVGRWAGLTTDAARLRWLTRRWMPVGDDVAVIGGGLVGLELGEFLAERGRKVTVLEPGPHLGLPMAAPRRWAAVQRAQAHGVTLVRSATVTEITPTEVAYEAGGTMHRCRATSVVVASEVEARAPLAAQLTELGIEVQVVGDATGVGYIEGAIHTAWPVAAALRRLPPVRPN